MSLIFLHFLRTKSEKNVAHSPFVVMCAVATTAKPGGPKRHQCNRNHDCHGHHHCPTPLLVLPARENRKINPILSRKKHKNYLGKIGDSFLQRAWLVMCPLLCGCFCCVFPSWANERKPARGERSKPGKPTIFRLSLISRFLPLLPFKF